MLTNFFKENKSTLWQFFLPIISLAGLLGYCLFVIYSGKFDSPIALRSQFYLIDNTLDFLALKRSTSLVSDHVAVVSIDEFDLKKYGRRSNEIVDDLAIESYANALEKVILSRPKLLVVRWLPSLHEESENYYKPLAKALEKNTYNLPIIIGLPQNGLFNLPLSVSKNSVILDDDICSSLSQTCPYNERWDDWVPQVVINKISTFYPEYKLKDNNFTTSMRTEFPNYILNLADPKLIKTFTLDELFLKEDLDLSEKIVFIGRSLDLAIEEKYKNSGIGNFVSPYNRVNSEIYGSVTPLHVFWAQLANMVLTNNVPKIEGFYTHLFLVFFMFLSFGYFCLRFSFEIVIFVYLSLIVFLVYINNLIMPYFSFYLLNFDYIIASSVSFIFFGFAKIIYASYLYWIEEAKLEQEITATNIQENFISLLSHNLNTPIARMQGAIGLLFLSNISNEESNSINNLFSKVLLLESVLNANLIKMSLKDPKFVLNLSTISLKNLHTEFLMQYNKKLERAGVWLSPILKTNKDMNSDYFDLPIKVDVKLWKNFWVYFLFVINRIKEVKKISSNQLEINWALKEENDYFLIITELMTSSDDLVFELFSMLKTESYDCDDFYIKSFAQLLFEICKTNNISVENRPVSTDELSFHNPVTDQFIHNLTIEFRVN